MLLLGNPTCSCRSIGTGGKTDMKACGEPSTSHRLMPEHQHWWEHKQTNTCCWSTPNRPMPEHQHGWANKLILIPYNPQAYLCQSISIGGNTCKQARAAESHPTGLCQSIITVGKTSVCKLCWRDDLSNPQAYARATALVGTQANKHMLLLYTQPAYARASARVGIRTNNIMLHHATYSRILSYGLC